MVANTLRYAVTVSRKGGEFLFFDIRRDSKGNIYFNFPKPLGGPKEWRPHTSVHGSGAVHNKDFNRKSMARQIARPDASFVGTENVDGVAMNPEQWRNIKKAFDPRRFAGKFQIDMEKLSLDTRRTQLQIDLVEPKGRPKLIPGPVLQKNAFTDADPRMRTRGVAEFFPKDTTPFAV